MQNYVSTKGNIPRSMLALSKNPSSQIETNEHSKENESKDFDNLATNIIGQDRNSSQ